MRPAITSEFPSCNFPAGMLHSLLLGDDFMKTKCLNCGKEYDQKVWFQRYCSDACRVAAMRKRKKGGAPPNK